MKFKKISKRMMAILLATCVSITMFPFANVISPKSETQGHLGINIVIDKRMNFDVIELCKIESIIYAIEDC